METALIISRFAQFAGVMLLFGTSLFRLCIGDEGDDQAVARWYGRVLTLAAIVTILSSFAWLGVTAGMMSGAWAGAENIGILRTVLFQTQFGKVWQWNLASAAILLGVIVVPKNAHRGRLSTVLILGLSGFLAATCAWTGHAVMHRGLAGIIHPLVQVVHVLAAAAWLGSLPALGFMLASARSHGKRRWYNTARDILPGYSRMGYVAVVLILLTGCLNSWFMVDGLGALVSTDYGHVLIAKIGLFLLMVGLAVANRFGLTPKIAESGPNGVTVEANLRRLMRNVALEQGLGISIIAAVSVLGTLAPAMSQMAM
jgi:putative copper resistance protein D